MTDQFVRRYYLHRATMTTGFFWPVFPLFLLDRGVSFAGIGTLLAVEAAVMLLTEVPTGFVGDRFGRRDSLVLGSGLLLAGELGFLLAHGFWAFVPVYVAFGLARTFRSGSGDAWLYDVLSAAGREESFTRVRGRGEATTHWIGAAAMVASGLLYAFDPAAPFVAAAALALVDVVVLATMPTAESAVETRVSAAAALPVVARTLARPSLRSFVAVAALFFGVERAVSEFIPSATTAVLDARVPLGATTGAGDAVFVGLFFAGFTGLSAVVSPAAGAVRSRVGAPKAVAAAGYLSAGLFLAGLLAPPVALVGFAVVKMADALLLPVVNGYLNDAIESSGRATTLSAASMVFTVAKLPLLVGAGLLADETGVFVAVAALGGVFVAGTTTVLLLARPAATPLTKRSPY